MTLVIVLLLLTAAPARSQNPDDLFIRVGGYVSSTLGGERNEGIHHSVAQTMGKTFVARLLIDFLRLDGGAVTAFDLNPSGDALTDYLPALATPSDVGDIRVKPPTDGK